MPPSTSFPPLPFHLSSFVGREEELQRLGDVLSSARLVTLTGPGGSGKTRLALELVRRRDADRPVVWVELADADPAEPASVLQRMGQAMGAEAGIDAGGLDAVVELLPPTALVAFDNCEHLLEQVASLVGTILWRHPESRILATSREPFGLSGERAWLVPPLSTEGHGELPEAVRLFVERAREVQPDFELDETNHAAVEAICRDLDGIPLAIELAAARTRLLTPAQIHRRLHEALDLLSRGGRTVVPRHRTLRATLDWSHALLDEPCARLLRRLAVFQGGVSLEGVEAIGEAPGQNALDTVEALGRLVDRSLVTVREAGGVARYHLLETVRMYAAERLRESGEAERVAALHAAFVVALVEEARPHFTGPGRRGWVERLVPELPNLRAALTWSYEHDPELHLRLAASLWWFWFSSRHWSEARRWLEGAVAMPATAPRGRRRAELLFALGALDALQGRSAAARPWLLEALDIARELDDASFAAYVQVYLGMSLAQERDPEAVRVLEPARDRLAEFGDLYLLRLAQILLGSAYANAGDMPAALEVTRAGVETARAFGQDRELGISLQALGILLFQDGDLEGARERLLESLAALERDPSIMFVARTVHFLALCLAGAGERVEAVRLLAVAEQGRAGVGVSMVSIDAGASEPLVAELRQALGDAGFEAAWSEGAALDFAEAVRAVLVGAPREATGAATAAAIAATTPPPAASAATPSPVPSDAPAPDGTASSAPPGPDLRLRLLGGFDAEVEGARVSDERWPYARPRELLALLALHREGRTRDQIAEAMWPQSGPSQARNSVHVTLHHLRKALERPEWIELSEHRYRLAPELTVEIDVERFEAVAGDPGADVGTLLDALALYRGDLLAGEVSGRWVDDRGDALRRLRRDTVLRAGAGLEARGDDAAAETLYAGLAAHEALDEELHRRLMAVWARRGQRARALDHFSRLVELLRDELDAEPESATAELALRLRSGSA